MTLKSTPDIEDVLDVRRFALGSWFRHIKERSFFQVLNTDGDTVIGNVNRARKNMPFKDFITNYVVEVPKHTYVNEKGLLFFVTPNNRSRTQQGYQWEVSSFTSMHPEIVSLPHNAASLTFVEQVFYPEIRTFREAIKALADGDALGVPLSSSVALIMPQSGLIKLMFHTTQIGVVEKGNVVLRDKFTGLNSLIEGLCK